MECIGGISIAFPAFRGIHDLRERVIGQSAQEKCWFQSNLSPWRQGAIEKPVLDSEDIPALFQVRRQIQNMISPVLDITSRRTIGDTLPVDEEGISVIGGNSHSKGAGRRIQRDKLSEKIDPGGIFMSRGM
jgi:hypothetical protein